VIAESPAFNSDTSSWAGERTTLDAAGKGREAPLEEFAKPTTTEEIGPDELEVIFDDDAEEKLAEIQMEEGPVATPTAIISKGVEATAATATGFGAFLSLDPGQVALSVSLEDYSCDTNFYGGDLTAPLELVEDAIFFVIVTCTR